MLRARRLCLAGVRGLKPFQSGYFQSLRKSKSALSYAIGTGFIEEPTKANMYMASVRSYTFGVGQGGGESKNMNGPKCKKCNASMKFHGMYKDRENGRGSIFRCESCGCMMKTKSVHSKLSNSDPSSLSSRSNVSRDAESSTRKKPIELKYSRTTGPTLVPEEQMFSKNVIQAKQENNFRKMYPENLGIVHIIKSLLFGIFPKKTRA